ncbi:MAG: hypothetical protein R2824_13330 [Saprospiraceae bacterium]
MNSLLFYMFPHVMVDLQAITHWEALDITFLLFLCWLVGLD